MKGYFVVFAIALLFVASVFADPINDISDYEDEQVDGSLLLRMRRSKCEFNACDRWCRQHGFPSGACVKDKCDCDLF